MGIRGFVRGRPRLAAGIGAVALVAVGLGIWWFGPQYLFVDRRVDEAVPVVRSVTPSVGAAAAVGAADEPAEASPEAPPEAPPEAAAEAAQPEEPAVLARGSFRGLEHETSGSALVLELADGSRFLRLEDLDTSNGPDLRVFLSDAPPSDDWYVYDDGAFVDLGPLKGNIGSSNYEIPPDLDLSTYRSAVVWCRRFTVGFGVAPIDLSGS